MGLRVDDRDASVAKEKAFVPQKVSDVVPFAEGHPFAAWDAGDVGADKTKRRPSMTVRRMVQVDEVDEMSIRAEGVAVTGVWRTNVRGKKHWSGDVGAYRIGWERAVLDMEARIHEALWEVNESHTFAEFPEGQEPKTVLDVSRCADHGADGRSGPVQACGPSLKPWSGRKRPSSVWILCHARPI
jgi:hypothetical protein